jgi:purine-binding chemotaxis protein CheW
MESPSYTTFQVGEYWLGIDARRVQEVLRGEEPTEVPLAHPALRGLINVRGQIVPVVDLATRLGLASAAQPGPVACLLVRTAGGPVALVIDWTSDLVGVHADGVAPLPDHLPPAGRALFHGAFRSADRVLFDLDVDQAAEL